MLVVFSPQKSTVVRNKVAPFPVRALFSFGSWLAPSATIGQAVRVFSAPSESARERARAADAGRAETFAIDVGCERLQVYVWGDPETDPYVLVAHGWSDFGLRFAPLARELRAHGYAVVAFDQAGHGRSSGATATLPDFARAIGVVGRRFGAAAAVIGHSMGGAAAAIALADGLAAERAVLVAPPADLSTAADRFAAFVGLGRHLRARFHRALERNAAVRFADLEAHRHVSSIGCPALIVHDLDDREVPWHEGERYARYWPDARMLSTTGLGHARILGDADVIGSILRFLRGGAVGERVVSTANLPYGIA